MATVAAVTAIDATAPAAYAGEAAAITWPLMPVAVLNRGTQSCDTIVARLVSMLVDIAGTGASNRGQSCIRHQTCDMQVEVEMKVMFRWDKVVYQDQEDEDAHSATAAARWRQRKCSSAEAAAVVAV